MIFGIIERQNDRRKILSLILSIKLCYSEKIKILLSCSVETKKYIENFGSLDNVEMIYLLFSKDNTMHVLDKFHNLLYLAVSKYDECLFIDTSLIVTKKITISNEIKEQGVGIIKMVSVGSHIPSSARKMKYSSQVLYVNKLEVITKIKELINHQEDISQNEINVNDLSSNSVLNDNSNNSIIKQDVSGNILDENFNMIDVSGNDKLREIDACKVGKDESLYDLTIPRYLVREYSLKHFLPKYSLITLREFFGYANTVKIDDLDNDLTIKENDICFYDMDLPRSVNQPIVRELVEVLIKKLIIYNYKFMNVINIRRSIGIDLIKPSPHGFYKWNREKDISGGMYELIDMLKNESYYSLRENIDMNYFMVGSYILSDKNEDYYLTRDIKRYQMFLCNYSKKVKNILDENEYPYNFLCYYSEHPKILEDFTNDKIFEKTIDYIEIKNDEIYYFKEDELIEKKESYRNSDYAEFLTQLENVKFGLIEKLDIHLISTFLSLNICPIIQNDLTLFELQENIHYLSEVDVDKYEELVINIKEYVKNNIKIKAISKKILNEMFTN
tara:strand:+ start:3806 stop:5479 length:1674 start_codon:yes stop_codon:yes gene_type:complete